jgi:hypothetical protein
MNNKKINVVIIDTNIFMQYKPLHEFKWRDLFDLPLEIVICHTVVSELDSLKDRGDNKKKTKARNALKVIERAMENIEQGLEITDNVHLKVSGEIYDLNLLSSRLSKDSPDDCIIGEVLWWTTKYSDKEIFFMSNDTAPKIKCKFLGLKILDPPVSYLLQNELDEQEEEIKRLKKELDSLKNAAPKLELYFEKSENDFTEVRSLLSQIEEDKVFHVDIEILKPMNIMSNSSSNSLLGIGLGFTMPTQQEVEQYNKDLAHYKLEYKAFEEKLRIYYESLIDYFALDIMLFNAGSLPAHKPKIELNLHKEDSSFWRFIDADNLPKQPLMPPAPKKPDFSTRFSSALNTDYLAHQRFLMNNMYSRDIVSDSNYSFVVKFSSISISLNDLPQGYQKPFEKIYVHRLDTLKKGFKLRYNLLAHNLPNSKDGVLNVRIDEGVK